jgi:hypothetical protein
MLNRKAMSETLTIDSHSPIIQPFLHFVHPLPALITPPSTLRSKSLEETGKYFSLLPVPQSQILPPIFLRDPPKKDLQEVKSSELAEPSDKAVE